MGGGGDFAPQFTKKSTFKSCRKLNFGMLAYVNPTKRNLRKKIGLTTIRQAQPKPQLSLAELVYIIAAEPPPTPPPPIGVYSG